MHIDAWIESVPPGAVYGLVALIIGLESLGIPLPGELALVAAGMVASKGTVNPVLVALCATAGAIIGDSIGYAIGRKGGKPLFEKLGRKFPRHFGPDHLATAERSFHRWGMWAVFFGRFIALLRIFAGPLAGALRMPYWKFLIANVLGGVIWAGGTTMAVYYIGKAVEQYLQSFSYIALALAAVGGLASGLVIKRRAAKARAEHPEAAPDPERVTAGE
ncbi:DedA family protein [Kitasatospora viridis]|uniref:Membrane protein DedA with SNARE-associated domain n=1 Tax=Kitasatospora viridis TaxID=281105 RepID=A0A561SFX4_9ACTN|nr:DedA family protein [Kitasatospora viridis]TWF73770.1 membrane protein DedA with SNARE-associated domain [Kitasatospora viridis]